MEPPLYPGRFGSSPDSGAGFAGSSDASVMGTNDDATVSKASCTKMGYVNDDFVKYFIKRFTKRAPVINRGYYARWAAVRKLLHQFLAAAPSDNSNAPVKKQVLSLGAGFDTTYFQLQAEGTAPAVYYEVDFLEVTSRKMAAIAHHPELRDILPKDAQVQKDKGEVRSSNYNLVAADLRNVSGLEEALKGAGFDPNVPTLVLAECVLIYLEAKDSDVLIRWAGDKIKTGVFVIYEQIRPDDAFGQQMIRNLEMRGCPLLGIEATPTLEAKKHRFLTAGWQRAEALDMDAIYTHHLTKADIQRIEKLEIFDEFEEWHIMQEHYCIALGVSDYHQTGMFDRFGFWPTPASPRTQRRSPSTPRTPVGD